MSEQSEYRFSTALPVIVYTRVMGSTNNDWCLLDTGPGYFTLPASEEASVRIKGVDDDTLAQLVQDLAACPAVSELILAENRNISDAGLRSLSALPWLISLNLSSCGLTNLGLAALKALPHLRRLNISYCNRLTDPGLKELRDLKELEYLDLQGCVKISHGGVARLRIPGLEIHK